MQSQLALPRGTEHDLRMFAVKVQARGGIRCHRRSYQEEERDEEEHVEKRPTWLRCAAQRARTGQEGKARKAPYRTRLS